jgi:hypothetical protein
MFNAESAADLQTTVPVSMEQKYKEEPLSWVQFIALLGQTPISDKMLKEISGEYNKGAA